MRDFILDSFVQPVAIIFLKMASFQKCVARVAEVIPSTKSQKLILMVLNTLRIKIVMIYIIRFANVKVEKRAMNNVLLEQQQF